MTTLLAGMLPSDRSASAASGPAWRLVRDADAASAELRAIAQRAASVDLQQVARELDGVVRAHQDAMRELFGVRRPQGAQAPAQRLRTQLAAAVAGVLRAALGADVESIAEESRHAIAGAILALGIAVVDAPEEYPPLTEQQRVQLLRAAIRGMAYVEDAR